MCKGYCYFEGFSNEYNEKLELIRAFVGVHSRKWLLDVCYKIENKIPLSIIEETEMTVYGFDKDSIISVSDVRDFVDMAWGFMGNSTSMARLQLGLAWENCKLELKEHFKQGCKIGEDLCWKIFKKLKLNIE